MEADDWSQAECSASEGAEVEGEEEEEVGVEGVVAEGWMMIHHALEIAVYHR